LLDESLTLCSIKLDFEPQKLFCGFRLFDQSLTLRPLEFVLLTILALQLLHEFRSEETLSLACNTAFMHKPTEIPLNQFLYLPLPPEFGLKHGEKHRRFFKVA
jgi:hypothetical protein